MWGPAPYPRPRQDGGGDSMARAIITGRLGLGIPETSVLLLHAAPRRAGGLQPHCRAAPARARRLIAICSVAVLIPALAVAQDPAGEAGADATAVTAPMIRSRLEQIETSSAYSEEVSTQASELYREALANLEAADAHKAAAARFEQARVTAPEETAQIRKRLASESGTDPLAALGVTAASPASEIEQRLQEERAAAAAAQARLAELEQSLTAAEKRPNAIRQRQAGVAQEIRELSADIAVAPSVDESDVITEARAWARQTRLRALTEETQKLDQELLGQPLRVALLEARRDAASRDLERSQARVSRLTTLLGDRRRSETEEVLAEVVPAELGEAADHPLVRDLMETNRALAEELEQLVGDLDRTSAANEQAQRMLASLERRYQSAQERLDVAGVSPALGRYLMQERRQLPATSEYRRESHQREELIAEAGLRDIRLEDAWEEFRDPAERLDTLLAQFPADEAATLADPVSALLKTRRDLLRQLMAINDDYLSLLSEYEYTEKQLFQIVEEYDDFIAERSLLLRSRPVLTPKELLSVPLGVVDFLEPRRWLEVLRVMLQRLTGSPLQILGVLGVLVFWWRLPALRRALHATSAHVGKPSQDLFRSTLAAVGITLVMTLPWPFLAAVTGYELVNSWEATPASRAVGTGLLRIAPLLFFLRFFRVLCMPGGVAEGHFRWSPEGLARLRWQMDLLMFTLLLPGFVMVVSTRYNLGQPGGAFTQAVFLVLVAGLMYFLYRLLTPRGGIIQELRRRGVTEEVVPWPWFWLGLSMLIPAGLGVMALLGYMYSAGTLLAKLISSMWLVFGLVFVRELVVRWLLVVRRRLLLREALQRREAARATREAGAAEGLPAEELAAVAAEPVGDIVSLDADTRKLLNVALAVAALLGLGGIWSEVLPAIGLFGDVALWESVRTVGGEQQLTSVTLSDLFMAGLVIALTVVAAGNLPSLLDIVLRQRPSITAGSRLAFATLARYTIAAIGLTYVLATIGLDWSKLQWLVAALGVGIGFGLQEIVANFISGLIILIERPVRVGDIVTVGDTSGVVTRVQIRATTIRTWDRQELLVPNKEFITGRVLNWSLSDDILRIHFLVGVAYGSDVERALALIEEAAVEHPKVLEEPAPLVTFESFGDNSLILGLRCFVPSLDVRLQTTTELHKAIDRKFREAGIVISFPQRDVHLDTSSPLEIRVLQGAEPREAN